MKYVAASLAPQAGNDSGPWVLASASQEVLVQSLMQQAKTAPAGALAGRRVYVVTDAVHHEAVAKALQRSGADYVRIDPTTPIAQRPERLQRLLEYQRERDRAQNQNLDE